MAFLALGAVPVAPACLAGQEKKAHPAKAAAKEDVSKPRRRTVPDLSGFEMTSAEELKKMRTSVGATRGAGALAPPELLAPRLAKFCGAAPVFEWTYKGQAHRFAIVFLDDQDEEVYRGEIPATGGGYYAFRYPSSAPRPQPGKTYSWYVDVFPPRFGASRSESPQFVMVSEAEWHKIEQALAKVSTTNAYQAGLERAKILTDHRLWFDALGAYSDLVSRYPDRGELYEQRGVIYAQLPVTKLLAEQDFARADKLSGR
jgi:hypothetical protein